MRGAAPASQRSSSCAPLQHPSRTVAAHRLRPGPPGAPALASGRSLRRGDGGAHSGGGPARVHRALSARVVPGSELAGSAALVDTDRHFAAPPQASSGGGAFSGSGSGGGSGEGFSSYSPASHASSSGAASNGAGSPNTVPPLEDQHRDAASTSELLRAVLKRRAERLQRQSGAFEPPAPTEQAPAAQQQTPPQQQQAPPASQAPPRYKTPWVDAAAGAAVNGAAAAPAPTPAPPQQPHAPLQPVPAPEQRVVRAAAASVARDEALAQRRLATVRFWLKFRAEWGQRLKVVGTHSELGGWVLGDAPELKWSQGDNWHTTVQLPAGGVLEYKYVLLDHSGNHPVAWQQGNNSVLALRPGDEVVEVFDNWGADPGAKLVADGGPPVTREHRLLSWATEMEAQLVSQRQDLRRSRMELAAAQEEAREARLEAQRYRARLVSAEAEKAEAANHLQQARALNEALQSQLTDTTASFHEALRTAADILTQIDEVSPTPDMAPSESEAHAAAPLPPPLELPQAAVAEAEAKAQAEASALPWAEEHAAAAEAATEQPAALEAAAEEEAVVVEIEEAALEAAAAAAEAPAIEEAVAVPEQQEAAVPEELPGARAAPAVAEEAAPDASSDEEEAALGATSHGAAAAAKAPAAEAAKWQPHAIGRKAAFVASTKRRRRSKGGKGGKGGRK